MAELSLGARDLRAGDRIVAIKRGSGDLRDERSNWVVEAAYGQIAPSGSYGIALRNGEKALWENTDWTADTTFFVVR